MGVKLRSRKTSHRTKTLYLDIHDQGNRWLEYLKLYLTGDRDRDKETLRLAKAICAKRQLEIANQEHGLNIPSKQKADFIEYCRKLGKSKRSPNTQVVWNNAIQQFANFAGEKVQFSQINSTFLQAFKDYLLKNLSPNSALVYLARIKTACHQAVRDGIFPKNPALDISIKSKETRREYLTLEELQKLAATPCSNQETKQAFLFSAFSGLRYSDVKALTWRKVRAVNGGYVLEFTQAKTGDVETLPLSEQAVSILKNQAAAKPSPRVSTELAPDAVFKLGAQQSIDKAIRQWVKRAAIEKKISFHCARHTFATLGLTHGVDLYTMSKLLGHRDVATTQIYAKIVDQKKREAVSLLPKLSYAKAGGK
ncbi:MAG: site-specific integrase [Acidobacteriota bacterium]